METLDHLLIQKKEIRKGRGPEIRKKYPFPNIVVADIHFQCVKADAARTLVFDTRLIGDRSPISYSIGSSTSLPAWDIMLSKMTVGEIAKFTVNNCVFEQLMVFSTRYCQKKLSNLSTNGMPLAFDMVNLHTMAGHMMELIDEPCDLDFIIELINVELTNESSDLKKSIAEISLSAAEKMGDRFLHSRLYSEALKFYFKGIDDVSDLLRELKPYTAEWNKYHERRQSLLVKVSECEFQNKDYFNAIGTCILVLTFEPNNAKIWLRRGEAYLEIGNILQAAVNFKQAKTLDPSLSEFVLDKFSRRCGYDS